MANEISLSVSLVGARLGAAVAVSGSATVASGDQADATVVSQLASITQTLTASSVVVAVGPVALGGWMVIKNMSTVSGFVAHFGPTGVTVAASTFKLLPGEVMIIRTSTVAFYTIGTASFLPQIQITTLQA